MSFRASFCDPFRPDIIELGPVTPDQVIPSFEQIPWTELLRQMQERPPTDIHFSPSLEIENIETRRGLTISAVGEPEACEFYIFYKRPQKVSRVFGLFRSLDENYMTEKMGQTREDALTCLQALLSDNHAFLDQKIK